MRCSKHRRYAAKRKPKTACEACWRRWFATLEEKRWGHIGYPRVLIQTGPVATPSTPEYRASLSSLELTSEVGAPASVRIEGRAFCA